MDSGYTEIKFYRQYLYQSEGRDEKLQNEIGTKVKKGDVISFTFFDYRTIKVMIIWFSQSGRWLYRVNNTCFMKPQVVRLFFYFVKFDIMIFQT